ncbi:uncharacterized protein [Branchiostoma lanceolatum]|uniref:uncharacterized protein n=1 Tax=Branchiostoma lanceolatum TaxID=7740 RepID=UPI00345220AE
MQFLRNTCNIDCEPFPYSSALDHRKELENTRGRVKSQLETIHEQHNPYQYDEDDPVVREVEIKRAEAIKNLFKSITVGRQEFIQLLTDECIAKLGPPPCKYAFIGLGSQATELVTPYSDLEFAILIEEGKDDDDTQRYFQNLTHYLHLKIINLGETILPAMAIPSLNDFLSEDPEKDWFFDSVTPRGFSFDGFMPWASKTPFGRDKTKSKPSVSLIQTPAKLAEYQQLHIAVAEGYHLSDILRRVSYLTGDESLVDEYMDKIFLHHHPPPPASLRSRVTASAASAGSSIDNLRRLLIEKFSTNRHHAANPENKEATRVFLTQTFESYGLDVTMQAFTSKTRSQGKNIIGTLPGRHTGTPADRPVLLAAHYDTVRDSPGVIDNGSGLAALLESARLITSQSCRKPNHTIIFVAFDFEESGKEGSEAYVSDVLLPYLNETGIPLANFQGAMSMDPLLNYNNTEGSQYIPPEFDMVPDPDNTYDNVAADGFRGNFIGIYGRRDYDAHLYSPMLQAWNGSAQYRAETLLMPLRDVYQEGPSDPFWPVYRELLRSDHASFWKNNPDLKAIQISDTGQFRGRMQQCYHQECDNIQLMTEEGLVFLKKTTDAVTITLRLLAGVEENCTDPDGPTPSATPSGAGIALQVAILAAGLRTALLAVIVG